MRFQEQPHNRGRGKVGEDDAVRWLTGQGYAIVERNVVNHGGEIDIVAREGETLCFIEIKARASDAFGPAIAAVDIRKQRRISRAAALYLAIHDHRNTLAASTSWASTGRATAGAIRSSGTPSISWAEPKPHLGSVRGIFRLVARLTPLRAVSILCGRHEVRE